MVLHINNLKHQSSVITDKLKQDELNELLRFLYVWVLGRAFRNSIVA